MVRSSLTLTFSLPVWPARLGRTLRLGQTWLSTLGHNNNGPVAVGDVAYSTGTITFDDHYLNTCTIFSGSIVGYATHEAVLKIWVPQIIWCRRWPQGQRSAMACPGASVRDLSVSGERADLGPADILKGSAPGLVQYCLWVLKMLTCPLTCDHSVWEVILWQWSQRSLFESRLLPASGWLRGWQNSPFPLARSSTDG